MGTQRRNGRWAPTTEIGRRSLRHGSRLAHCKGHLESRANRLEQADAVPPRWNFLADAAGRSLRPAVHLPVIAARNTLQLDTRNQQPVRSFDLGSPPLGRAAGLRPPRLIGYPPSLSPAVFARIHPTLPHVSAALGCRTERYDGKGNLYFKHAA
jgi:hypothetical protein